MRHAVAGLLTSLLLLALAAPPPAAAQTRVGGMAGVAMTNFGGDDAEDAERSTGFLAGAFLSFPLTDAISLRPGAQYIQKGAEGIEVDDGIEAEVNLSYIEIPALLMFRVPTEGSLGVHFLAGPVLALEMSCELEASVGGQTETVDCDDDQVDIDTKSTDFGLGGGVGVSFPAGENGSISIEALYNLGLTQFVDEEVEVDVKNRAFVIQAGVSFPVGG